MGRDQAKLLTRGAFGAMTNNNTPDVVKDVTEKSAETAIGIWDSVLEKLRTEVTDSVYSKWLQGLDFVADVEGVIQIAASTGIQRDRVNTDFLRRINLLWAEQDSLGRR